MSDDSDPNERVCVQAYLPRWQKEAWAEDADEMDMSLSEFVRAMVQAGRRGFDLHAEGGDDADAGLSGGIETSAFRSRVRAMLEEVEPLTFDELHVLLAGEIEATLSDALVELQEDDVVVHSREGYRLAEEGGR